MKYKKVDSLVCFSNNNDDVTMMFGQMDIYLYDRENFSSSTPLKMPLNNSGLNETVVSIMCLKAKQRESRRESHLVIHDGTCSVSLLEESDRQPRKKS